MTPEPVPGAAAPLRARTLVTELAPSEALPETTALLGDDATAVLLESAAEGSGSARSILVQRPWLRLHADARGEVCIEAAAAAGEALLPALAARLRAFGPRVGAGALTVALPPCPSPPELDDDARLRAPSVLDAVRAVASLVVDDAAVGCRPSLAPGVFGCFAFDLVDHFEDLPPRRPDPLQQPDLHFVHGGDMVVIDRRRRTVQVVTRGLPHEGVRTLQQRHADRVQRVRRAPRATEAAAPVVPPAPPADVRDDAFVGAVARVRGHILSGDVFQAVPSRCAELVATAPPLAVYRALRAANPSPYMFFLPLGGGAVLLGASPETCVRHRRGDIEIRPIAGTVARGRRADGSIDPDLDGRLGLSLLLDPKEQAEHAMLLDLARNDVARVCVAGTTRVVEQLAIDKYSHVQHLVSRVRGHLRPGLDALHAYRAAANMGTLTGAPKLRAAELLRELEPTARGLYGGAVGYLLADGELDTCIAIRCLLHRGDRYHARAGAGVVLDSDPQRELLETEHKLAALRAAVEVAS